MGDGRIERTVARQLPTEPLQNAGELLAQALGLEKLPFIEGGAVLQTEACQKVAAIESCGRFQILDR